MEYIRRSAERAEFHARESWATRFLYLLDLFVTDHCRQIKLTRFAAELGVSRKTLLSWIHHDVHPTNASTCKIDALYFRTKRASK